MGKRSLGGLVGTLTEERDVPLYRQVYHRVRDMVLDGTLQRGVRLPSTRSLGADLGVSRNTVVLAFELLELEGYIESWVGDGTYVSQTIPEDRDAPRPSPPANMTNGRHGRTLSARGERIRQNAPIPGATRVRPFVVGVAALDQFPWQTWSRIWSRQMRELDSHLLSYDCPMGHRALRTEIAQYLNHSRGVRCTADNVIIVSSSQQALDLAGKLLLDPGDPAWIEEPGYHGARGALQAAGAKLVPVPVDDDGLNVVRGEKLCPQAKMVYVTPSHQYPLGSTMSLERRLALLEWAAANESWIIEDDYDGEFRYKGRPITALQGLDRNDRTIYVGTFTKCLYPALRLAYVVPPPDLVPAFLAARLYVDRHPPVISQLVLAKFFEQGHFTSHLRRMRVLYKERQDALVESLSRCAGDLLTVRSDDAGMHVRADLPAGTDDVELSAHLEAQGFAAAPLSRFYIGENKRPGFLLGYTAVGTDTTEEAASRMCALLRDAPGNMRFSQSSSRVATGS